LGIVPSKTGDGCMIPTDACELMTTLTAAAAVSTASTAASQKGE
jgi:hypothetical protein